jgi:hypothetical protein
LTHINVVEPDFRHRAPSSSQQWGGEERFVMDILVGVFKVVHVASAVLLAWPYYALAAVNQRALLGPPLGDRTDTYMENVIKSRTVPCFVFQATVLVSGIALMVLQGMGLGALIAEPLLGTKFVLLLLIAGLLTYVHLNLQPRIDAAFSEACEDSMPSELAKRIGAMRLRRKRIASICMFVVLTNVVLGVQVSAGLSVAVTVVLIVAVAVFTWRAFSSTTPFGWV